jgi:predicted O-methyltransferase YrrM
MYQNKYAFYLYKMQKVGLQAGLGHLSRLIASHILSSLLNRNGRRFAWERRWVTELRERSNLTVVEIGVRHAGHAEYMLNSLDIEHLYLIDPYDAYGDYQEAWDHERMSSAEERARSRLKNYEQVTFVKEYSSAAVDLIPEQVDLVYIDGNHAYEYVQEDIANYYDRIRAGGILAGHDYVWPFFDVIRAVEEFNQKTTSQLQLDLHGDWWFKLP